MEKTKEDLTPLSKKYFDASKSLLQIFGTSGGHFFYNEIQAKKHCSLNKEEHFLFMRDEPKKESDSKKISSNKKK